MPDLFGHGREFERLRLPGADVRYMEDMGLDRHGLTLADELRQVTPWRQETVTVWGKEFLQPRLTAWYGDSGIAYSYSGITMDPLPWTPTIAILKNRVEELVSVEFNSVLLNLYRDGNDRMGFHSDNERDLGERPIIASVSLGATRRFTFQPIRRDGGRAIEIELRGGSLLVMAGDTQKNWKHAVPKESRPTGPRVNLTFRRIGLAALPPP